VFQVPFGSLAGSSRLVAHVYGVPVSTDDVFLFCLSYFAMLSKFSDYNLGGLWMVKVETLLHFHMIPHEEIIEHANLICFSMRIKIF